MKGDARDLGSFLGHLVEAGVRFVVVAGEAPGEPLRVVVSRHPTNLQALGRVLALVGASPRPLPGRGGGGPRPIAEPHGTIAIHSPYGDVELLFGGAGESLYAEMTERSVEAVVGGVRVLVGELPSPPVAGTGRPTEGEALRRRLLALAEALAERIERERRRPEAGADP